MTSLMSGSALQMDLQFGCYSRGIFRNICHIVKIAAQHKYVISELYVAWLNLMPSQNFKIIGDLYRKVCRLRTVGSLIIIAI